ncbi:MAG TPA: Shedu anti-phage system protein SduA domain-containing protein [Acidimicrobiales bacterium]|nr:Shedu anti-phage system protein SduA domain-containing protein [Acidimicrobiales bacterium]
MLLEEGDPNDESIFQTFLERHPCLVPGGDGSDQSLGGHHGGWRNLLISQPPLPGITRRVPDFMWLSKTSEDIIPVLVEIEAPGKRWLTKGGDRTADLTHAEGQLAAWNRRLDDPASRQMFADLYDFPSRWATEYNLEPRFVLIYGRRTEFEGYPDRNLLRRGIRERGVAAMTFDRLSPLAGSNNSVCVKIRNNRPVAIAIPPTFRLGPGNADEMAALDGLDDAIRSNSLITDERRRFLLERLPYWKGLAAERERGGRRRGYRTSDWE